MTKETIVVIDKKLLNEKKTLFQKLGLTPLLFLNLTKATTGLFLSQLFLYLYHFRPIFPTSLNGALYLYVAIIAIAAQAGVTVGRLTDALVLMLSAISCGLLSAWIIACLSSNDILMVIFTFLSFYFFLFFRQFGPRWLGFTIFGCLIAAFAIISTVNGGYSYTIQPLVWYTIVSFLIGGLISFSVCFLMVPTFATIQCRSLIKDWICLVSKLVVGTMNYYDGVATNVEQLDLMVVQLRSIISQIEVMLGDASSEFNYSVLPFPILQRLAKMLREVTEDAFGMLISAKTFKKWADGVKTGEGFDYTKMKVLVTEICSRVEIISSLIAKKLNLKHEVDLICSTQDELIEVCVDFEAELRNSLDYHYSALDKVDKDWISNSESILSIYHFSMTVENTIKKLINLDNELNQIHLKGSGFYSPIYKWIPFSYIKAFLDTFNPENYRKDGNFSVLVVMATFKRFLQRNIWTLKSAVCMTLFLIIFLNQSSREFWNKYSLSGGLITLIIVLTPNMGSAYLAVIFQIIGSVGGNTLGMAFYYAFGNNPYLLWMPMVVIGVPSYYIMIVKPQFTSIPLLLLIGFASTTIACWNQQFITIPSLKFDYSWIWARSVVSLLIGLAFGTGFNLFAFPSFAKHDLRIELGRCLVDFEGMYLKVMDVPYNYQMRIAQGGISEEESGVLAKKEMDEITSSLVILSGKLFSLRTLLSQAILEPEIEMQFVSSRYLAVIEGMEVILNGLKGARLALDEPWFNQESIRVIWVGLFEKRNNLVKTMQVVYRLYESSILMKRKLIPNMPSALQVRGELSYHVLSTHLSKSLSENAKYDQGTLVDEDSDWKWRQARLKLYQKENCTRSFGVGTLTDIYYYSYVSWMKVFDLLTFSGSCTSN